MSEANDFYWMLTEKHQGIRPPSSDWLNRRNIFDAGSKYHLADNTPFLRQATCEKKNFF
jgi:Angiotensin-converting enzyme